MEKRGQKAATMFLDALVKSVQSLCHGYLEFQDGIEIMGFINLSVDKENSVDCVLKEKVCKTGENATSFISNSYHAKPAPEDVPGGNGGLSGSNVNLSSKKSNTDTRDSDFSGPSHVSLKRKALDDLGGEGCSKKSSSRHSHSSLKTSHLQASSSHCSGSTETEHSDSTGGHGQNLEDIDQVKLTGSGIVLERVNEQNCGGDESNDFDVTFIKEEYMEEENAACEFEGSTDQRLAGSQFNGRGQNPNAGFGLMSTVSQMDPASSFKAEVTEQDDNQGSTSFQLHPGSSGMRGEEWSKATPKTSDDQKRQAGEGKSQSSERKHPIQIQVSGEVQQQAQEVGQVLMRNLPTSSTNMSPENRMFIQTRIYLCEYCDASFTSHAGLYLHRSSVHFKRKFECSICDKKFTRKETLTNHMLSHTTPRPHNPKCPFCPAYLQPNLLKHHIATKHPDKTEPE